MTKILSENIALNVFSWGGGGGGFKCFIPLSMPFTKSIDSMYV